MLTKIVESAAFRTARDVIRSTDELTVAHMCAVTGIAAPTTQESARALWLSARFAELGLEAVTDEVGNVFAVSPAALPHEKQLVIASHLDTVFAADTGLTISRANGRIAAPGISDNARGLAGLLAIARALHAARWPTRIPIAFVGTVGEEGAGDLRGAKHYIATRGEFTAAFIALDGAGAAKIIRAGVGSRRLRIRFRGPGGHSWSDFGTPNAIHASAQAIAALCALPLPAQPQTTLSVGRIGGGTTINAIPEEAWFEVDLRSEQNEPLRDIEARVRAALADVQRSAGNQRGTMTCDIEVFGDRPAGETAEDNELVQAAIAATTHIGYAPELTGSSTDANVAMAESIPAISIGAGGSSGGTHTLREWYDNEGGVEGIERALIVVLAAAGIA